MQRRYIALSSWPSCRRKHAIIAAFLMSSLPLFAVTSRAAAIKVLCDSPVQPALTKVDDLFRGQTNNQVTLACDAGPAIKKRNGTLLDLIAL